MSPKRSVVIADGALLGRIGVIIPCHRVRQQVDTVIGRIGPEVDAIYVVDDACPEASGDHVENTTRDPRVTVLRHSETRGVGAATLTGMRQAVVHGADILVKVDGDGQIDPKAIPRLVRPLVAGEADYAKGNRFYDLGGLHEMPPSRRLGNAALSFMTKLSSGYWTIFDPTNGFVAIVSSVFRQLPASKIDSRYFFESDMLFRLNLLRAVVVDVPVRAISAGERKGLRPVRELPRFLFLNLRNTVKRVFYGYLLRDFSIASLYLLLGLPLLVFGVAFGAASWWQNVRSSTTATTGTVMVAVLPIILGVQLVLSFLGYDIQSVPRTPVWPSLEDPTGLADDP